MCQGAAFSSQLSVISRQQPAISHQHSAISEKSYQHSGKEAISLQRSAFRETRFAVNPC